MARRSCASCPFRGPVHPLFGAEFDFVERRLNWGEDRVSVRDERRRVFSLPAGWTDVASPDLFTVIAAGRCPFTTSGLLELAGLVDGLRAGDLSGE